MSFHVVVLFLLTAFTSVKCYPLLVQQLGSRSLGPDQIFRTNTLYSISTGPSVQINCSLPSWFNETALGKANVYWVDNSNAEKHVLIIDPHTVKSGSFKCVARNIDDKPFVGWDDTVLKYYRSDASQISVGSSTRSVLNYTLDPEPIVFECKTDKSPVVWFLDDKKLTEATNKNVRIHINNTLVMTRPSFQEVGVYMCKVEADETLLAFHSLEGPPFFAMKHGKSEDSENKLELESVVIQHELYGNPLPVSLKWYKRKNLGDPEVEITEADVESDPRINTYSDFDTNNGILELSKLKTDDRAYYIAKAFNNHGNSTFQTLVRVKGRLDALWPFLGIMAEVAILVAIILIYERRRKKQDREADENLDQKKPLTSTNSENVRQRKN